MANIAIEDIEVLDNDEDVEDAEEVLLDEGILDGVEDELDDTKSGAADDTL